MDYGKLHGHYVYRFLGSVKFFSFICLSPFPCVGNPWRRSPERIPCTGPAGGGLRRPSHLLSVRIVYLFVIVFLFHSVSSHDFGDGSVVVTLHLPIGDLAVAFRRLDAGMPQKILDGDEIRIGIEQLGGHGVTKLMTGSP
jgi:hypothetical protein